MVFYATYVDMSSGVYVYIYIYLEYPDLLFGTWSGMNKNIYSHILSEIFSGILTLTSLSGIRPG